ncbi:MAG: hypothetical protein R2828_04910 [Saprospiraceae bacterium]
MFAHHIVEQITKEQSPLKEGFHIYTNREQGKSYFYYVLASKKVLLLSKAFQKAKSAQNALHRLYRKPLLVTYQRVTDKHKKQHYHIQLLDGNQKPIAVSYAFDKLQDAKLAYSGIQDWLNIYQQGHNKDRVVIDHKEEGPENPTRHSFRIDFYQEQKGQPVRGHIEYLLTRDKEAFNGLAIETIEQFFRKFIVVEPKEETKASSQAVPTPISLPAERSFALSFWESGQPTTSSTFEIGTAFELGFTLEAPQSQTMEASIFLKALDTRQKWLIASQKLTKPSSEQRIPIFTQNLQAGIYQLIATLEQSTASRTGATQGYQSSSLIQFY